MHLTTVGHLRCSQSPKPSGAGDSGWKTGHGTRAAVVGAVLGLVPATILGPLRIQLAESPESTEQVAGNVAFPLFYVSPYHFSSLQRRGREGQEFVAAF